MAAERVGDAAVLRQVADRDGDAVPREVTGELAPGTVVSRSSASPTETISTASAARRSGRASLAARAACRLPSQATRIRRPAKAGASAARRGPAGRCRSAPPRPSRARGSRRADRGRGPSGRAAAPRPPAVDHLGIGQARRLPGADQAPCAAAPAAFSANAGRGRRGGGRRPRCPGRRSPGASVGSDEAPRGRQDRHVGARRLRQRQPVPDGREDPAARPSTMVPTRMSRKAASGEGAGIDMDRLRAGLDAMVRPAGSRGLDPAQAGSRPVEQLVETERRAPARIRPVAVRRPRRRGGPRRGQRRKDSFGIARRGGDEKRGLRLHREAVRRRGAPVGPAPCPFETLGERERRVLDRLVAGAASKEIGRALDISPDRGAAGRRGWPGCRPHLQDLMRRSSWPPRLTRLRQVKAGSHAANHGRISHPRLDRHDRPMVSAPPIYVRRRPGGPAFDPLPVRERRAPRRDLRQRARAPLGLSGPCPLCVLLDHVMPGMDGLEVCRRLRDLDARVPVILITGHPNPRIRIRAREAGVPLVDKPLAFEALVDLLAACRPAPVPRGST